MKNLILFFVALLTIPTFSALAQAKGEAWFYALDYTNKIIYLTKLQNVIVVDKHNNPDTWRNGFVKAKLFCANCGHNKEKITTISGYRANFILAVYAYFDAELWLQMSFKNDVFWAYNDTHLVYLEQFIAAKLREHKDRSHFTLLEKLPKFYHEGKNREALLKIIDKLKKK